MDELASEPTSFLLNRIVQDLRQLTECRAKLDELCHLLGGSEDDEKLRQNIKTQRETGREIRDRVSEVIAPLSRPGKLTGEDQVRFTKLCKQYMRILSEWDTVYERIIRKEARYARIRSTTVSRGGFSSQEGDVSEPPPQKRGPKGDDLPEILTGLMERDIQARIVERSILEESAAEIKEIETEMVSTKILFEDLAKLVGEQGEDLELIQQRTAMTATRVESAVEELDKSSRLRSKQRCKNMCCCCAPCFSLLQFCFR